MKSRDIGVLHWTYRYSSSPLDNSQLPTLVINPVLMLPFKEQFLSVLKAHATLEIIHQEHAITNYICKNL